MQNVEQPLIVLVKEEKQCVHLYGEHTKTIPFDDIFILDVFLEGKQVYYIQELSTVDGTEVVEVVEELPVDAGWHTEEGKEASLFTFAFKQVE